MQFLPPPAVDLKVEPEPVMPVEAITDDTASALYNGQVESWGKRGWGQVASMCRWAVEHGMVLPFACPPAPKD